MFKNKNKGSNDSERKHKIKKQLISTGAYIALAAAVVIITSNSVKKILNGSQGYEIPDFDTGKNQFVELPLLKDDNPKTDILSPLPEQKQVLPDELIVSESPENISAQITEPEIETTNTDAPPTENVSGEPEDEEYLPEGQSFPDLSSEIEPKVKVKPASGYISREFSKDELIYTPTMNDFRTHDGIDITGDIGSPVIAFADGIVEEIFNDPLMGVTVVLSHSGGLVSSYSNLSENLPQNIAVGSFVGVGETIGGIGDTAITESAEVPHVHFEIYKDEVCVNPEDYIG